MTTVTSIGTTDRIDGFKLERLKFVLSQIDRLNTQLHRHITLFQGLTTAIIAAGAAVVLAWRQYGIGPDLAAATLRGLVGLLCLFSFFIIVLLITGIVAWYDYRSEEARILNEVIGAQYRRFPTYKNFYRWHEFWMIVLVVAATAMIASFAYTSIIPLIK